MFKHVLDTHLKTDVEGYCRWEGCEKLQRKKWSLVTHVQVIDYIQIMFTELIMNINNA